MKKQRQSAAKDDEYGLTRVNAKLDEVDECLELGVGVPAPRAIPNLY